MDVKRENVSLHTMKQASATYDITFSDGVCAFAKPVYGVRVGLAGTIVVHYTGDPDSKYRVLTFDGAGEVGCIIDRVIQSGTSYEVTGDEMFALGQEGD